MIFDNVLEGREIAREKEEEHSARKKEKETWSQKGLGLHMQKADLSNQGVVRGFERI